MKRKIKSVIARICGKPAPGKRAEDSTPKKRTRPRHLAPKRVSFVEPTIEEVSHAKISQSDRVTLGDVTASTIPVYVIGDSHSLTWDGLVVRDTGVFSATFSFRSSYCRGLKAAKVFQVEDSLLNRGIFLALEAFNLVEVDCDRKVVPFHQADSKNARNTAAAFERPRADPAIVLCAGDIDLRTEFVEFFDGKTFFLEADEPWAGEVDDDAGLDVIDIKEVYRRIVEIVRPLVQGARYLTVSGFGTVFIPILPPPTRDDEKYARINPAMALHRALRYRLVHLFNQCLVVACQENGVRFLGSWGRLVDNSGYLKEEFEIDGVHLNRAGISEIALDLINVMAENRRPRRPCGPSHAHAKRIAVSREGLRGAPADYLESHITTVTVPREKIENLVSMCRFENTVENECVRWDWTGNSLAAFSDSITYSKPDKAFLAAIYDLVYSDPIHETISCCLGSDFVVYNVRPFQSVPHGEEGKGPQSFHYDGCPDGIIRGILYLVDVDETSGPFEYQDKNENSILMTAPAGTLLIFDATKIFHRGNPPREKARRVIDFVFAPRIPSQERMVMSASMNNWPVDPFQFTSEGMLSYSK